MKVDERDSMATWTLDETRECDVIDLQSNPGATRAGRTSCRLSRLTQRPPTPRRAIHQPLSLPARHRAPSPPSPHPEASALSAASHPGASIVCPVAFFRWGDATPFWSNILGNRRSRLGGGLQSESGGALRVGGSELRCCCWRTWIGREFGVVALLVTCFPASMRKLRYVSRFHLQSPARVVRGFIFCRDSWMCRRS